MTNEFLALDLDGNGDISVDELDKLLRSMKRKLRMSETEITRLVRQTDENGDGTVSVDEFLNMVEKGNNKNAIHKELIQRSGVRKAFQKYDADGSGTITRDEFRKIVEDKYQTRMMPDQINEIMSKVDVDESGKIEYDEFLKAFTYFPVKGSI